MLVLATAVAFALHLPDFLAGGLVQGDDLPSPGVDQLEIEAVAFQYRRGVHTEAVLELAVAILDVELPNLLAVKVQPSQVAASKESPDVFAVGVGRGGGVVSLTAALAGTQLAFPQFLAVGADTEQHHISAVGAGEEEAIAPGAGGGGSAAGELEFPGDVLRFRPLRR